MDQLGHSHDFTLLARTNYVGVMQEAGDVDSAERCLLVGLRTVGQESDVQQSASVWRRHGLGHMCGVLEARVDSSSGRTTQKPGLRSDVVMN